MFPYFTIKIFSSCPSIIFYLDNKDWVFALINKKTGCMVSVNNMAEKIADQVNIKHNKIMYTDKYTLFHLANFEELNILQNVLPLYYNTRQIGKIHMNKVFNHLHQKNIMEEE